MGDTDIERTVFPEEENLDTGGSLQGYLALMDHVWESALQRNPCVMYDLAHENIGRFVLDKIYDHSKSYYQSENGDLVFNRLTSMDRIEIVLPQEYRPAFVNHSYTESERDGNTIVEIQNMGLTQIEVRMELVATN